VPDAANPPKTVHVLGHLARSSRDGCLRIYLDLKLDTYYEIEEKHILHAAEADREREELPTLIADRQRIARSRG
jgi:hypothetical protein